jgi:fatty-acyl-CoA synthase
VFVVGDDPLPALAGLTMMNFGIAMDIQGGDALASGRAIRPDEPSSWFCTGGTTGAPKIARRTHGSEVANARMINIALAGHAGPGRNFFCGLPLFHVNAAMVTGLVPWLAGSHVVCGPANVSRRAVIANFWALVEAYRINVPPACPRSARCSNRSMGTIYRRSIRDLCAAPMHSRAIQPLRGGDRHPHLEGYGLTSRHALPHSPIDGERRIGSIGQALPWQKMKCVILDESGLRSRGSDW